MQVLLLSVPVSHAFFPRLAPSPSPFPTHSLPSSLSLSGVSPSLTSPFPLSLPSSLVRARTPSSPLLSAVSERDPNAFSLSSPPVTRSRQTPQREGSSIVVTDGSGSFYSSRALIQALHDHGKHRRIVAAAGPADGSRKMLLGRTARYSGLVDVLEVANGGDDLKDTLSGSTHWLAVNIDEETLEASLSTAEAAGVYRVVFLFTRPVRAVDKLLNVCKASAVACTVVRTGPLVDELSATALELGPLDAQGDAAIPREAAFRFVTEAMTLSAAEGRDFSLLPSDKTSAAFRAMRYDGSGRREEVEALLLGRITPSVTEAAAQMSGKRSSKETTADILAQPIDEATREAEIRAALERARKKGIETQAALKAQAEAKLAEREARRAKGGAEFRIPGESGADTETVSPAKNPVVTALEKTFGLESHSSPAEEDSNGNKGDKDNTESK